MEESKMTSLSNCSLRDPSLGGHTTPCKPPWHQHKPLSIFCKEEFESKHAGEGRTQERGWGPEVEGSGPRRRRWAWEESRGKPGPLPEAEPPGPVSHSYYNTTSVLLCLGITALVCLSVTVFSFQTKVSSVAYGRDKAYGMRGSKLGSLAKERERGV